MLTYVQQSGDPYVKNDAGDRYSGLDRFGRVSDQYWFNTTSGASTGRSQYGYDRASNLLYMNNLVTPAQSELYHVNSTTPGDNNTAYDPLGRLTAFARGVLSASGYNGTQPDRVASASASQSWNLDATGNWSGVTTSGTTTTRGFNAQNQATSISGGTAPTFDANGNTTSDNGQTYTYDAWNRLMKVIVSGTTGVGFSYDALGRRIVETYPYWGLPTSQRYYSPQQQLVEERKGGTAPSNLGTQYVWGLAYIDSVVLRDTFNSGTWASRLYAEQDLNFNTIALIALNGTILEQFTYTPYGQATYSGTDSGWVFLYKGGQQDYMTAWVLFRNRELITTEGRWAQRDPLGLAAGDLNVYHFVGSNPTTFNDPTGLIDDGHGGHLTGSSKPVPYIRTPLAGPLDAPVGTWTPLQFFPDWRPWPFKGWGWHNPLINQTGFGCGGLAAWRAGVPLSPSEMYNIIDVPKMPGVQRFPELWQAEAALALLDGNGVIVVIQNSRPNWTDYPAGGNYATYWPARPGRPAYYEYGNTGNAVGDGSRRIIHSPTLPDIPTQEILLVPKPCQPPVPASNCPGRPTRARR